MNASQSVGLSIATWTRPLTAFALDLVFWSTYILVLSDGFVDDEAMELSVW